MEELKYLKEALEIEEEASKSAAECYDYYRKAGDSAMAESIKKIMEDENRHRGMIGEMIEKLEK